MASPFLSQLLALPARERADLTRILLASLPDRERGMDAETYNPESVAALPAETTIRQLVAELAQTRAEAVELNRRMDEQGIDSLHLIVLRERVQEAIGVVFSDEAWASMRTPADILAGVNARRGGAGLNASPLSSGQSSDPATPRARPSHDDLEIGMPLTGRNNLAETPLLQYLGDLRWRQLSQLIGVPSREIVDEQGERLYATFFYVDVAFPSERPMAAFGENDRFKVDSSLARYGTSMLDGVCYLIPADKTVPDALFSSVDDAITAGVPAVRLSNVFVRQFGGAEWLKKGRPAHPKLTEIPALPEPPDSYALIKRAEQSGSFALPDASWTPITDGPVERDYRLIPDRDLNGAGLVYFANYPMFLDICERDVLLSARRPLTEDLVDRRTLLRRQSAYLNNASSSDTLRIEIEPWVRIVQAEDGERSHLLIHVNGRMYRRSDNRLMMVSTARKIVRWISSDDRNGLK